MLSMFRPSSTLLWALVIFPGFGAAQSRTEIETAMKEASRFFVEKVARHGGYVYYTSPDLSRRLGEGPATDTQIWVQPPGTPTVGMSLIEAYQATGDRYYMEAARKAATALIYGQLESGGWTNLVDFDPESRRSGRYRNGRGHPRGRNFSSLDDDISQSAIRFLCRLDEVLDFRDQQVHQACVIALDALLQAQFPNGAFPQGWDESPVQIDAPPNLRARYPSHDWRTEGRIKEYWDCYTLNDDLASDVTSTLLEAWRVYEDERYLSSLRKLGDFLVLAQMPAPQPGWAQQYNYDMEPIWARKFEPPAISGRETESVIEALLRIAVATREKKYLEPIGPAIGWLRESTLKSENRLARYYELQTNRPLYMFRRGDIYELTYDDSQLPGHYGWKTDSRVSHLEAALDSVYDRKPLPLKIFPDREPVPTAGQVISSLDTEGAWISRFANEPLPGQPKFQPGEAYIHSGIFARNLEILSRELASQ